MIIITLCSNNDIPSYFQVSRGGNCRLIKEPELTRIFWGIAEVKLKS